jgi:hypothetical protein
VLVSSRIRQQHLGDALDPGGLVGDGFRARPGDQHMHIGAERLGGSHRLVG